MIGNGAYQSVAPLANPRNDAEGVSKALEGLGFEIFQAIDFTRSELEQRVQNFLDAAAAADVIFIYYAGHGVQIDSENFLVPIDAAPAQNETGASFLPLNQLLASVESRARSGAAKIVVLDACRDNPWASASRGGGATRGLARIALSRPESGQQAEGYFRIIAYATAPGTVAEDGRGANSPYTGAFLRYLEQEGLEVTEMFRRTAAHVLDATDGRQRPEYLVQTSRTLFFRAPFVTECDRLAVEAQNFVGLAGVPFDDIVPARAIPACEAAVREQPDSARLNHNLARAYEKAERLEEAVTHYRIAAGMGLPAAINALGVMHLAGCGVGAPDVRTGLTLMVRASRFGNLEAEASLTAHDLLPHLSKRGLQALQAALTGHGLYSGPLDGRATAHLHEALGRFQQAESLRERGLTLETVHALGLYEAVPEGFQCH